MAHKTLLKGQVLSFTGSPFDGAPEDAVQVNGAVLLSGGHIEAVGDAQALAAAHTGTRRWSIMATG